MPIHSSGQMARRMSPGRKPAGHVEGMASKRKRQSDELKHLLEDQQKQFEDRIEKQAKIFEDRLEKKAKIFEDRLEKQEKQLNHQQKEIKELKADLKSSRRESRELSYCRMLNAYLNIIKFAKEDEPVAKKRRNSKQFQNNSSSASMVLFIQTVYPSQSMSANSIHKYFKDADSFKDQRDRLTHPRSIVELRDEALLFSAMLKTHREKGDELNAKEIKFLDVFSKIDELCAAGVGNLRL
jgi:hypothetical protein